jgi:hypothetical protein
MSVVVGEASADISFIIDGVVDGFHDHSSNTGGSLPVKVLRGQGPVPELYDTLHGQRQLL